MPHILTDITENSLESDDFMVLILSLAQISFLNYNQKKKLLKKLDSPRSLVLLSIEEIFKLAECDYSSRANWNGKENYRMARAAAYQCKRLGIKILLSEDQDYPETLRQISDPPFALFARGNHSLLSGPCISVVGTRKLSPAGRTAARQFSYDATADGCNVVSGLAAGADTYAHLGALDVYYDSLESEKADLAFGHTIAVLPGAIDNIVPYTNRNLAAAVIKSGGCIISEYAPGMPTMKWQFVARNRIVAGLSTATVVIEAPAGSGALITADFALEEGRDVMFHEVAFGDAARQISQVVKMDLEKRFAVGRISRYKMENTTERFLSAGAPVIKDYNDCCKALAELPGMRSTAPVQGELFT